MATIEHTEQTVELVRLLAVNVIEILKMRPLDLGDLVLILAKPDMMAALKAVKEGISDVPAEMKDLTWLEGFELSKSIYGAVTDILAALKG